MKLQMAGVDFHTAPLAAREGAALTAGQAERLLPHIRQAEGVAGCVLLSTCNRTELYLRGDCDPAAVLRDALCLPGLPVRTREGEAAARHLFAVAAGLESQILGDGQIITQAGNAIALARRQHTADSVLDSLFRRAVTAGKRVKTETVLTAVPASAAWQAVRLARERFDGLQNRRAVVIGNGEMGRLAAALLRDAGCAVTVTLRSYRHGETVVPAGCATHPYDGRYAALEGADLVVSATASPHCTLTARALSALREPPRLLIDLAVPRDIEPEAGNLPGVEVIDLDGLGSTGDASPEERRRAQQILDEEFEKFRQWDAYRAALPEIAALKEEVLGRLRHDHAYEGLCSAGDTEGMARLAVCKTVGLLLGGMKENISPGQLQACLERVRRGSNHGKR
ncbi:glutamyl-tRNA reductase [Clostridiaceae bacterium]|nr:glutamyl-tRNA reductase [Clostridiaceae bacterium]